MIIKAAAGGGGKGGASRPILRFRRAPFSSRAPEALSAFGNGEVYIEKYPERPRHIEFRSWVTATVTSSTRASAIAPCSAGIRKLIEEALKYPLTQDLRERMGNAAVKGAKAIDYVGAGTIEMLLNEDKSFLLHGNEHQYPCVEHPVTEMLTGVDYREGADSRCRLPAPRFSVKPPIERRGHVIECRVNAEDPARNFQPSPGRIDVFHPPGGPGVRLDTHAYAGYTKPPYYDSLLAKVICQGERPAGSAALYAGGARELHIIEESPQRFHSSRE